MKSRSASSLSARPFSRPPSVLNSILNHSYYNIKDDWDASDDEKPAAPAAPKGPIRQKGITKQKIAEREAAERAEAERAAAEAAAEADPAARRKAARERELRADIDNAKGLFGDDVAALKINGVLYSCVSHRLMSRTF